MHGGVINENTAPLHHFFHTSQVQRVGAIPAYAGDHHFQRAGKPFEDFVQGAVDQTFAEIKHGLDCRFCLLRQNLTEFGVGFVRERGEFQQPGNTFPNHGVFHAEIAAKHQQVFSA